MHTMIIFLAWYIYFNKKGKIGKMISVCIDLALFIEVYVPSQESDQCVYRSCFFLLKYMYQARKVISVCIDHALFIGVYVPIQESDQCVYRQDRCTH
jgi:hypothetical protein